MCKLHYIAILEKAKPGLVVVLRTSTRHKAALPLPDWRAREAPCAGIARDVRQPMASTRMMIEALEIAAGSSDRMSQHDYARFNRAGKASWTLADHKHEH